MLLEDVEYFLEKTKAKECFDMLDLDRDGKISLQVTCAACCAVTCAACYAMSCAACCAVSCAGCCATAYDLPPSLSSLQIGPEQQNWS